MTTIRIACMIALFSGAKIAVAQTLAGTWKSMEDGNRKVQFYQATDGFWYGKTIKAGHLLFQKCAFDAATSTFKGTMHPPDMNMGISVLLTQEGHNKLKTRLQKGWLSKTMYFLRDSS
jgi:hypothetical protein